jgi:hypothetical protein
MSNFEITYQAWLEQHMSKRSGERLRRLQEGHGFGERTLVEKIWWPAIGSLDGLHPEYEVFDYKDGSRFLDLAFIKQPVRINIENMGFGSHVRHASRHKYKDDQRRQRHLAIEGWIQFYYSHDEIVDNPRACQQELLQLMGRLFSGSASYNLQVCAEERDLLRFIAREGRPVSPIELTNGLGKSYYLVRQIITELLHRRLIHASSGSKRIRSYVLDKEAYRYLF